MDPKFKLFHNDETLKEAIDKIKKDGVRDEDIYILAHDNDHVRRSRKDNDANKVGVKVTGLGTATKNIFRSKDDKLVRKMEKIGFETKKAEQLEDELDKGKVLLIVTQEDPVSF